MIVKLAIKLREGETLEAARTAWKYILEHERKTPEAFLFGGTILDVEDGVFDVRLRYRHLGERLEAQFRVTRDPEWAAQLIDTTPGGNTP